MMGISQIPEINPRYIDIERMVLFCSVLFCFDIPPFRVIFCDVLVHSF